MKVINNWQQTNISLYGSTFSGVCNVNKCGLFLRFSSVEANFMFSAWQLVLFSPYRY